MLLFLHKRYVDTRLILLGLVVLLICGGCAIQNNPSTASITTATATDFPSKTYRAEKNSLELAVNLPSAIQTGERFILSATITNHSADDISFLLPSSTENMHFEIHVSIVAEDREFIDAEIYGKAWTDDVKIAELKAGASLIETINFLPGWQRGGSWEFLDKAEITWASRGNYQGKATFYWGGDYDSQINTSSLSVDFPVVIV